MQVLEVFDKGWMVGGGGSEADGRWQNEKDKVTTARTRKESSHQGEGL